MVNSALTPLIAVSPIDGRYAHQTASLSGYFSEYALMKYRVRVEIEYFIALCDFPIPQLKTFGKNKYKDLRAIFEDFSPQDAEVIKTIEKTTNHDVKAVEYFLKERFEALGVDREKEFIHFGLTSQDVNNTAIPLSLKEGLGEEVVPAIEELGALLQKMADNWRDVSMLARTHGQPASPTRLGKEFEVFHERLKGQLDQLASVPYSAKFGGATGNFNAHHVAYPAIDWKAFGDHS